MFQGKWEEIVVSPSRASIDDGLLFVLWIDALCILSRRCQPYNRSNFRYIIDIFKGILFIQLGFPSICKSKTFFVIYR